MKAYRDSLEGLRSTLQQKCAEIEHRNARISPVLWALLPENIRSRVEASLRDIRTFTFESASLADLTELDRKADEALATYEAIAQREAEFRLCPLPPKPRAVALRPFLMEEPIGKTTRQRVTDTLLDMGIAAEVERIADKSYLGTLALPECSMHLVSSVFDEAVENQITIGVPPVLDELVLSVERPHQRILRKLGLSEELHIGAARFDARFWIVGSELTSMLLTRTVQQDLLLISEGVSPTLLFRQGVARLEWKAELHAEPAEMQALRQAIRLMRSIRRAIKND